MPPHICHYYVTLRCNDTCEFCSCWRNSEYQNISRSEGENQKSREAEISEIVPKLRETRIKGVKKLNITGGEPLLRDDLPEILKAAKTLGFEIELTTNGILYLEKGKLLNGLVDRLFFSLDYPVASEHDRSRGIDCYNEVLKAIRKTKEAGNRPIINFTLTRDSVRFLPEMVDLAEKLGVLVFLNPVYDFFGTQGFEKETIDYIIYYFRRKNVLVNRAAIEFVKTGGNNILFPRCRARETTITFMPDGCRVAPCFFNSAGRQGREAVCASCMRWPYMLPSFTVGWDKYWLLDVYSRWLNSQKEHKR